MAGQPGTGARSGSSQTDTALPHDIDSAIAGIGPRIGLFASGIRWYSHITSTNDLAVTLAGSGVAEGAVIGADAQSAGRGRLGRTWVSPSGAGIYASVVLRPEPYALRLLTMAAGVALVHGIQAATGLQLELKWPNDVVALSAPSAQKVAGILAEGGTDDDGGAWVVVGFGINVRNAGLPREVASRATSLERELGRPVDRGLVFAECLAALSQRYEALQRGNGSAIVAEWRACAARTFGRAVEWSDEGKPRRGVIADVDDDGALIVRTESGAMRIISGEVRWL
jgi:BirA family biotin operon repressor/biotin-[acetyl-CoA-carboxylase] ligase